MANINDTYFNGQYKDIWRAMIPEQLTAKEVEFMVSWFKLEKGSRVLDLMCGYGRHALALAERGIEVVAVDNLADYTIEIERKATENNLPVTVAQSDILTYQPQGFFDLAICMGNSLNFFNRVDSISIFKKITPHLKSGASLLINTWTLAETVNKNFKESSSGTVNGLECFTESKYLYNPTRIESETRFVSEEGEAEIKQAVDYVYSVNELELMLGESGLIIEEIYAVPGKRKFSTGDPRAYIIARKV